MSVLSDRLRELRGATSQAEMARQLNVNKSSVTRQLAVLEEKGYIRREPAAADKRILLVYPTQKALDVKKDVFQMGILNRN